MEANTNTNSFSSAVNGTDDRGAHPKNWYVAQVQMNCEKKSAKKISSLGYETFVPMQEEIHQWSDRKKKIERILIPMMVFFKGNESGAKEIERTSFVYSLLKAPGQKHPATIPDDQIERFKFMLGNCDDEITIEPNVFEKGDPVRVVRGTLKGFEGIVRTSPSGKTRIFVVLDFLGSASVEISLTDLEHINLKY